MHMALKVGHSETVRELEMRGGEVMRERRRGARTTRQLLAERSGRYEVHRVVARTG